jgi:hypothetical protein
MKTILIVETNLDDLRATKENLVKELDDAGNLKKWGDDSVETNDDIIYFLKVISLTEYVGKLNSVLGKGYDELKIDPVIDEVRRLFSVLDNYPNSKSEQVAVVAPEFTGQPESDDNYEDDLDDENLKDELPEAENDEEDYEEETDLVYGSTSAERLKEDLSTNK